MLLSVRAVPCRAVRFSWRELMVDTARHFLPMPVLRNVVDSMVVAKLNVLHVHWVDSQAFPLVLPSAPRLAAGAWSAEEKYSLLEVAQLRDYCSARGVRLVTQSSSIFIYFIISLLFHKQNPIDSLPTSAVHNHVLTGVCS